MGCFQDDGDWAAGGGDRGMPFALPDLLAGQGVEKIQVPGIQVGHLFPVHSEGHRPIALHLLVSTPELLAVLDADGDQPGFRLLDVGGIGLGIKPETLCTAQVVIHVGGRGGVPLDQVQDAPIDQDFLGAFRAFEYPQDLTACRVELGDRGCVAEGYIDAIADRDQAPGLLDRAGTVRSPNRAPFRDGFAPQGEAVEGIPCPQDPGPSPVGVFRGSRVLDGIHPAPG